MSRVSSKGGEGGAQGKFPPKTPQFPPQSDPTSPPPPRFVAKKIHDKGLSRYTY